MKIKHILIFLILLTCLIGAVSAAEDVGTDTLDVATDDTVAISDVQEEVDEVVSTEPATDDTLQAQENQEELKAGTKTVEVNDFNELTTAINGAVTDSENDTYVINLNPGTYTPSAATTLNSGKNTPNIIINGNGQTITSTKKLTFANGCNIIINDITFEGSIANSNSVITLNKVTLDNTVTTDDDLKIIDSTINKKITNNLKNLEIINSTLNAEIANNGNVTIDELSVAGSNIKLSGTGKVYTNNTNIIAALESKKIFVGSHSFENENMDLEGYFNYGTLSFINCSITSKHANIGVNGFRSYGNLFIINSTSDVYLRPLNGNVTVENSILGYKIIMDSAASLIIDDDTGFISDFYMDNSKGTVISNNPKIFKYFSSLEGNYVIRDSEISGQKTYSGNITLINCTISQNGNTVTITNNGNLTVINSTIIGIIRNYANLILINSSMESTGKIQNYGFLTVNKTILTSIGNYGILVIPIDEDKEVEEVYGPNLSITNFNSEGMGVIETNDMSKIFPYMHKCYQEMTVALGTFDKKLENFGILTIENTTLTNENIYNEGTLILKNTTVIGVLSNAGLLELRNVTINGMLINRNTKVYGGAKVDPTSIISDDTQFGEEFVFQYTAGTVITNNTEKFAEYMTSYQGNVVLTNKTIINYKINYGNLTLNNCKINSLITNYQNLTLNNCTINSNIVNNGRLIIDENTVFADNVEITGSGEIIIDDISRILPYISVINGNYVISDKVLSKTYTFYGTLTLNNCTITGSDNVNYATLILNKCTVDVGADNTFLTNLQTVHVSSDTTIHGKINDLTNGVIYENLPQNVPKTYIITQDSIKYFIDITGLNTIINPGDILDIRGRILLNNSLRINKPVNIISSTKDGYIDLNTTSGDYFGNSQGNSFIIEYNGAYTNITGVYFHNTQLWIYGTHHVTFDNVSVVVDNQRIGSGVGILSIREGSSYVTVKNSYLHTTENQGSSTLVLALADYCTIENNTIEGDGFVGNLIYLTTYNVVSVPSGMYNSHNKIINNRIRGPEKTTSTCYGICISGFDNLVENNTINYAGYGIMFQWGSGVTGTETAGNESLVGSGENIVRNNKLYGGCGINAGDLIYNNYMEGTLSVDNAKAYNNTANRLTVGPNAEIYNNTISGEVTFTDSAKNSIIDNNNIRGNVEIPTTATNITLSNNNIIGSVTLDGSFNNITNNKIMTSNDYAIFSNKLGVNNTLTDNYMVANGKVGADAVSLRDESNTIQDSTLATNIIVTAPSEVTVNNAVQITIKLTDKNGNPISAAQVTVTTSAGSEVVNITNGQAVYQYTPKAVGQDTISVKFTGNASLYQSSNSVSVKVVAQQSVQPKAPVIKITAKKNAKVDYGFTYKVRITSDGKSVGAGKQVTLKIAGKTLKAKTDKNGYATFTLAVKPKTYTGTVTYNKLSQKYGLTVKNVIVAKNTNVKKSAKKPTVKVTLKTSAKKPIKNKKITIKINGKKITVKANKKGVVTFNIKKIVKKLKAGKKYKYQVIYGKNTVTKTLKVIK